MHPLPLKPLYRRYLWGGRRFASALGRPLPPGDDYAESWELVDREDDQSIVAAGPLAGATLGSLVRNQGAELLGRMEPKGTFPLLFKFLDACRDLSVQVHPDDVRASTRNPPDRGKTEAWYIIEAAPGSRIYAGLRTGVDRHALVEAVRAGRCADVLHSFEPRRGDCVFIPAGTIHALGAGLLVAEIQQSSDVTYRLHDWNRLAADGKPRPLHLDAGLEAITHFGPVTPVPSRPSEVATRPLVDCDYFGFEEVRPTDTWSVGGDGRCHFLAVLSGVFRFDPHWKLPQLTRGRCALVPAAIGTQVIAASGDDGPPLLLHVSLPASAR